MEGNQVLEIPNRQEWRMKFFIILFTSFILICGCKSNSNTNVSAGVQQKESKYDLKWTDSSPTKDKIENSKLIGSFEFLVLFYGLQNKPYIPEEFRYSFQEYDKASNEFERNRLSQKVIDTIEQTRKELSSNFLCVKISDLKIGEYDFNRQGFPIYGALDKKESMQSYAKIEDTSASGKEILSVLNSIAIVNGYRYPALNGLIVLDNAKNKALFPSFISVDEHTAERLTYEFGTGEDPIKKRIEVARGRNYEGYKTAVAYIIFKPKKAQYRSVVLAAPYDRKEIHGEATDIVLATNRGTILGVYSISENENRRSR